MQFVFVRHLAHAAQLGRGMEEHTDSELPTGMAVDDEDIIRVILEHLRRHGHIEAMRALEREAGVEADVLGRDAAFLRTLVMDGRWEDVITLLEPLRTHPLVHEKACFEIGKQEFLEMLEDKGQGDNATALVKNLQRLESGCSRKEFNDLCFCLTLPGVRSHPEYSSWSPHAGRLWCFEALREYLGLLFPGQESPVEIVPEGQLELLCKQACMYQAGEAQRVAPNLRFPRSVLCGLLSQTWRPKSPRKASRRMRGMANGEAFDKEALALTGDELSRSQPQGVRGVMPETDDLGFGDTGLGSVAANIEASRQAAAVAAAVRSLRRTSGASTASSSSSLHAANHTPSNTNSSNGSVNGSVHRKHQRPLSQVILPGEPGDSGGGAGGAGAAGGGSVRDSAGGGGGSIWSSPSGHGSSGPSNKGSGKKWNNETGSKKDARGYEQGLAHAAGSQHQNGYGLAHRASKVWPAGKDRAMDPMKGATGALGGDAAGQMSPEDDHRHSGVTTPNQVPAASGTEEVGRVSKEVSRHSTPTEPKKQSATPGSPPSGRRAAENEFANGGGGLRKSNGTGGGGAIARSLLSSLKTATQVPASVESSSPWTRPNTGAEGSDPALAEQPRKVAPGDHVVDDRLDGNGEGSGNGYDEARSSISRDRRQPHRPLRPPARPGHAGSTSLGHSIGGSSSSTSGSGGIGGSGGMDAASTSAGGASDTSGRMSRSPKRRAPPVAWEINFSGLTGLGSTLSSSAPTRGSTSKINASPLLSVFSASNTTTPEDAGTAKRVRGKSVEPNRFLGNVWSGSREQSEGEGTNTGGTAGFGGLMSEFQRGLTRRQMMRRQRSRSMSFGERGRRGLYGSSPHHASPEYDRLQNYLRKPRAPLLSSAPPPRSWPPHAPLFDYSPPRPHSLDPNSSHLKMDRGRHSMRHLDQGRKGLSLGDGKGSAGGLAGGGRASRPRDKAGSRDTPGDESDVTSRPSEEGDEVEGFPGGSDGSWRVRGAHGGGSSGSGGWGRRLTPGVLADRDAARFLPTVVMRGTHPVRAVAFSPDGWLFAAGSKNHALRVYQAPTEEEIASSVEVSDERGSLQSVEPREVLRRDSLHRGSIYCLGFSPDSSLIVTGSNDKMLRVLPLPLLGIDTSSPMDPAQVDGSPHGEGMSEGGTSQGVRAGGARAEASNRGSPGSSEGLVLRGHTGTIRDLCFPWTDQSYLPVDDHGLQDRNSLSKSDGSVPPWAGGRPSVEGSAASRLLSAGAGDFACRIWDLGGGVTSSGGVGGRGDTLTPLVVFRGHTATVFSCSMLPGGEVAVTGGADAVVRVWDARAGKGMHALGTEGREVLCVRPWPRDPERFVATSHSDGSCSLWDLRAGRPRSILTHHTEQTRFVDFSPDGSSLLTASDDGLTGVCRCRHFGGSASGAATAGGEGGGGSAPWRSVKSWGLLGGHAGRSVGGDDEGQASIPRLSLMASLRAHRGRVLQACWRPTGRPAFLTSSTDCSVLLWTLPQEEEHLGE